MKPTQEQIISWAEEAGMDYLRYISEESMQQVERFVSLVAAAEREECAKVCDGFLMGSPFAAGIRSRGQK